MFLTYFSCIQRSLDEFLTQFGDRILGKSERFLLFVKLIHKIPSDTKLSNSHRFKHIVSEITFYPPR